MTGEPRTGLSLVMSDETNTKAGLKVKEEHKRSRYDLDSLYAPRVQKGDNITNKVHK